MATERQVRRETRTAGLCVALRLLSDYECFLDVQMGMRPCFVERNGERKINQDLPRGCAVWMCSEIYLPGYENPTPTTARLIEIMRRELATIRHFCVEGDAE